MTDLTVHTDYTGKTFLQANTPLGRRYLDHMAQNHCEKHNPSSLTEQQQIEGVREDNRAMGWGFTVNFADKMWSEDFFAQQGTHSDAIAKFHTTRAAR
jgi:hypothetical protein